MGESGNGNHQSGTPLPTCEKSTSSQSKMQTQNQTINEPIPHETSGH